MQACANQIENLEALLSGEFPQSLQELFTGESGLFPSPREISFQCSCPDWAIMCKHVAAVLYGVGNRLDENPFLFFTLRGIDLAKFIDVATGNKVEMMLEHANEKMHVLWIMRQFTMYLDYKETLWKKEKVCPWMRSWGSMRVYIT